MPNESGTNRPPVEPWEMYATTYNSNAFYEIRMRMINMQQAAAGARQSSMGLNSWFTEQQNSSNPAPRNQPIESLIFEGVKMFTLPIRVMNAVLTAKNLPITVDLHNLPQPDQLESLRAAVKKAHSEIEFIIAGKSTADIVNGQLVNIGPDGTILDASNDRNAQYRIQMSEYGFEMRDAKRRVQSLLPSWLTTKWDTTNRRFSIIPVEGTGNIRQRVIPAYIEELNRQDRYSRHAVFEPIETSGPGPASIYLNSMFRMEEHATKLRDNYIRIMRAMFKMNLPTTDGGEVKTHDTFQSFSTYMKARRQALATNDHNVFNMPILPHGTTVNLTWGIEVEAAGARGVSAPSGWERKSDSSLRSAYGSDYESGERYIEPEDCDEYANEHREMITDRDTGNEYENPDWRDPDDCEYCGYVYRDDDDDYGDTAEFVSPILRSFHSQGLESLVAELSEQPQNDSAGVHVHVGAGHLSPRQIGSLVLGYQMIEPLIEASYQRQTREYCKARPLDDVSEVLKSTKVAKYTVNPDRNDRYGYSNKDVIHYGDRYHSLNLLALAAHGTVEFRAMGPVYDYESLIKWASFCREMVNCAANGAKATDWSAVKDWNGLMALFAKFGVEYAKAEFAEIKALTGDKVHALASSEI